MMLKRHCRAVQFWLITISIIPQGLFPSRSPIPVGLGDWWCRLNPADRLSNTLPLQNVTSARHWLWTPEQETPVKTPLFKLTFSHFPVTSLQSSYLLTYLDSMINIFTYLLTQVVHTHVPLSTSKALRWQQTLGGKQAHHATRWRRVNVPAAAAVVTVWE